MRKLLFLLVALSACAPAAPRTATPTAAPAGAVHWTRTAAEHRALFLQIYRDASERLRELAATEAAGTWAVILDTDETVLDNSTYQKRRAAAGLGFTAESWNAWVREASAPALPGAAAFIRLARQLGGRVVIVTNRDEAVCPETRANLDREGIAVDLVLCKPPETSDKNPRFQAVARGTASPTLPALEVLLYVGDNIHDFPGLAQTARRAPAETLDAFGRTYFILPNPMYGSWERNPAE